MSRRRNKEELKALVNWVRWYLGVEDVARPDMLSVLSKAQQLFVGFSYRRVPDAEIPEGKEAMQEAGEIRIPERTFRAILRGDARARFTAAHELGHFVLRHPEVRFRGTQLEAYEKAKQNVRIDESEANQFAALFLAPDHLIQEADTPAELIERFRLSPQTAAIRKDSIDAAARRQRGELRPLPAKVIDFLSRQNAQGYKVTALDNQRRSSAAITNRASPGSNVPRRHAAADAPYGGSRCPECGNLAVLRQGNSDVCRICGHSSDPD